MGASNFTYVEATWTQALADWIGAHTRAFAAIGGVPRLLVPDNARVAVIKACLYEPQVNRTYAEMAAHYGTAVLPTRPHPGRATRRLSHTAPCRDDGAVMGTSRAGRAPRPPHPLRMVCCAGSVHSFRDAELRSDFACREHATSETMDLNFRRLIAD
jgi:hypothetical protein